MEEQFYSQVMIIFIQKHDLHVICIWIEWKPQVRYDEQSTTKNNILVEKIYEDN